MSVSSPALSTELGTFAKSFARSLRASNRSENTVKIYSASIRFLEAYLVAQGMPTSAGGVRREHVESFLAQVLTTRAPATAAAYYRSLQQFFRWLLEEGEITASPMARMRPPHIPEAPPPVLQVVELQRLLKTCEGRGFAERRDMALLVLLLDTGMRRAEIAGLKLDDIDLELQTAQVLGKGRRPRACPFGRKAAQVLDRYLRSRSQHGDASLPWLWLGRDGRLTDWGIAQAIERRAKDAGVDHANLHRFRHTAAHLWMANGGSENGAMQNFGWRSRQMLGRYGASAAAERARDEHRKLSPADNL